MIVTTILKTLQAQAEREKYENLAIALFSRNPPIDRRTAMLKCRTAAGRSGDLGRATCCLPRIHAEAAIALSRWMASGAGVFSLHCLSKGSGSGQSQPLGNSYSWRLVLYSRLGSRCTGSGGGRYLLLVLRHEGDWWLRITCHAMPRLSPEVSGLKTSS